MKTISPLKSHLDLGQALSKCCGGRLVGFYHHGDKDFIFLSDRPLGGRVEQVGWDSGTVRPSNRTQEICIDP